MNPTDPLLPPTPSWAGRVRQVTAAGTATVVLATLVVVMATPAQAKDEFTGPRDDLRRDQPVPVSPVRPTEVTVQDPQADLVWDGQPAAVPPQPGIAVFDLGDGTGSATSGDEVPVSVGVMPGYRHAVPQATPGRVRVEVLDQQTARAAGVSGLLVAVTGAGQVPVELSGDYSSFADLFGGGWAQRLRWVELPACAATTPQVAGCVEVSPLASRRRPGSEVSTTLTLPGSPSAVAGGDGSGVRLLALTADPASQGAGDYRATDLSPAGSWTAGGNDGSFTYSYPLRLPPAAGPVPSVGIGYSSASHDGRTSGSNNQASWVGDGWGYQPGFIERSYTPCARDSDGGNTPDQTGDLCWDGTSPNVTISLNGTNTSLVLDDDTDVWRAASDPNWRIELLGSPATPGSATTERWKVTTTDGTQFFFSGEASSSSSRLTVPVFGNHTGEACHATGFADSSCRQAYRWMLDKVVDVHGNMSRYFYTRETGHYGAGADPDNRVAYHRAAVVERIEYGLRADDAGIPATGRVLFEVADRCLQDCGTASAPNTENWPDTPWDLECDTAPCTSQLSPVFFTTKRLVTVTTQVHDGAGFADVDSWQLAHQFLDYGDDEQVVMWLDSIQHTGHVGGEDITLPKVEFTGEALPNRVDAAPGVPVMWRSRMFAIKTETGAVITVDYLPTECTPTNLPTSAHANDMRCYPVRWTPPFQWEPIEDWFHKHVVASVVRTDTTGGQVAVETSYEYATTGGGTSVLWAFDDSEFTDDEHRTYGMWRGYPQVTTLVGDPAGQQIRTRTRFYRGMDGQPLPAGGRRSVQLSDGEGNTVTDHEALAGRAFETLTYDGTTVISGATTEYWTRKTATRQRDHDGGDLHAWMTAPSTETSRTLLVGTTWQRTETRTTRDDHGRPIQVNSLGDTATSGDELCTRTEYADNTTDWIMNAVKRTETVSVDCGTSPARPDDLVSDQLIYYDGSNTHGSPPVKGLPTRVDVVDHWDGGPVYVTTARSTYDSLGRGVSESDALDRTTTTAYTPAGAGPLTQTATTNPLGHQNVTELEPAWGLPAATVEPNGRRTDLAYDALGRLTSVWLPGRNQGTHTASMTFDYLIRDDGPSSVTTRTLNHAQAYVTSIALYDSLLRQRQAQTDTADGGRLLTEMIYNAAGQVDEDRGPHYNDQPPSTSLVQVEVGQAARRTVYVYDGAGRVTDEIFYNRHVERWRTTTSYGGSSQGFLTSIQPPEGAPATATITNVRGQTTEKRAYHSNTPTGAYDTLTYHHTPTGQLETMTDQAGNQWSWDYDLRGREVTAVDPDTGTTTMTYDVAGQLLGTTDARGQTLTFEYDQLGRKTTKRDGDGVLLAEWEYDTAINGIGMLAKATRWHNGEAYSKWIRAYNPMGLVSQQAVILPASLGPLAGTHFFTYSHYPNGQLRSEGLPAIAAAVERGSLSHGYDQVGNPTWMIYQGQFTGTKVIVDQATYTPFNEIRTRTLGASYERQAWHGFVYEEDTRRLQRATFDRQATIPTVADMRYTYDNAGNVLSIADLPADLPGNHELQCFTYDTQQRLVQAWAQADTSSCATTPDMSILGGPAPYWHTYTHDKVGNRTSDTLRTPGQDPTHRTYTYPQAGQPQPHALQQVTTTSDTGNINYTYDPAGNTTTREVDGILQTLTWNTEGHLEAVSEEGDQTTMIYDADGSRLIRDDGDTLSAFLPQTELVWNKTTDQVQGTRYFTHNGQVVATCTGQDAADWTWMSVDHHGTTATHSVNAFTGVDHVRRMDPYGNTRGPQPQTWPGQQGYVAGIHDPTGLIHIGARTYDPTTGRFITTDPILDPTDDQQINGYTYANNNPTTWDDPTGLCIGCWLPDGEAIPVGNSNSTATSESPTSPAPTQPLCGQGSCYVGDTPSIETQNGPSAPSNPCAFASNSDYCRAMEFIVDEMKTNSTGPEVASIRYLLKGGCQLTAFGLCLVRSKPEPLAALSMWAGLVCQDYCRWDHKPQLREMFGLDLEDLDSLMFEIPRTGLRINFDVWSNIHYGYVGSAAGIDRNTLNFINDLPNLPVVGRQDKSDALYQNLGIDLYLKYRDNPGAITTDAVHAALMSLVDEHGGPSGILVKERKVLPAK